MELSGMPGQGLRVKLMATRSTSTRKAAIVERLGTCTLQIPSLTNLAITWEWSEYLTLFRETLLKPKFSDMTSIRVMVAIIDPTPRHIATAKEDSWATAGLLVPEPGPPAQTATLPSGTRTKDIVA